MNAKIMRYAGIIIMILAHPIGYFFWRFVLLGPSAYSEAYENSLFATLIGIGILEFFFVGLILFVLSIMKETSDKG